MSEFLYTNAAAIIALISLVSSFIISLVYKKMVNQNEIKAMREEIRGMQAAAKEAQKSNNQKDFLRYQEKILELTNKQMQLNMKPMFVTLIVALPAFMIIPFLYGVNPAEVNEGAGTITYRDATIPFTLTTNSDPVLTIAEQNVRGKVNPPFVLIVELSPKTITFENAPLIEQAGFTFQPTSVRFVNEKGTEHALLESKRVVASLPFGLPVWGAYYGWLGWYIITSIPFSMITRKLLGVH